MPYEWRQARRNSRCRLSGSVPEVEQIRHAPRQRIPAAADCGVEVRFGTVLPDARLIIVRPHAGKHPGQCSRQIVRDMPASSIASHAVSRNSRCCGSRNAASRGDIPKNSASNLSMPAGIPRTGCRGGAGERRRKPSRSAETGLRDTHPPCRRRRRARSTVRALEAPGRRQPIPTMAIGSWRVGPPVSKERSGILSSFSGSWRAPGVE